MQQDLGAQAPGCAREIELPVAERAEVRVHDDAVAGERKAADAVHVGIGYARRPGRCDPRDADAERESGAIRLEWNEQRFCLHGRGAKVAEARGDPAGAERQLDGAERIAGGDDRGLGFAKLVLALVEHLDLAALRVDDARVVGDEGPRGVRGERQQHHCGEGKSRRSVN